MLTMIVVARSLITSPEDVQMWQPQPRPLALASSNFTALERRTSGGIPGGVGHRRDPSVVPYDRVASPAASEASGMSAQQLEGLPPPRVDWQLGSFADEVNTGMRGLLRL